MSANDLISAAATPRRVVRGRASASLAMLGLKQFDQITGRVHEQNLGSARPGHDVVSEFHTDLTQPSNLGRKIIDNQVNAIPTAWLGALAVRHRSASRAGGAAQQ